MKDFLNINNAKQEIYAGFTVRFVATIIDTIFTLPLIMVIFSVVGIEFSDITSINQMMEEIASNALPIAEEASQKIADFVYWVILMSYSIYFLTSDKQATPGKRIMNIYVATKDGNKLSLNHCFARFFASILSGLLFGAGFLLIIFTKEKTALHDLICNTRVFYGKK